MLPTSVYKMKVAHTRRRARGPCPDIAVLDKVMAAVTKVTDLCDQSESGRPPSEASVQFTKSIKSRDTSGDRHVTCLWVYVVVALLAAVEHAGSTDARFGRTRLLQVAYDVYTMSYSTLSTTDECRSRSVDFAFEQSQRL